MKTIISLTSIPSRFKYISTTLDSLLAQDTQVDKIILYVPKYYQRFNKKLDKLPTVPDGIIAKFSDTDYGPATKILPAIKDFFEEDVRIIFCDDDRIYPKNLVSTLISASKKRPNDVIAIEGNDKKFKDLSLQYQNFSDIHCISAFVGAPKRGIMGDPLFKVLENNNINPERIDFLSIDIDGCDLEIFEEINFKPKVVLLEGGLHFNPKVREELLTKSEILFIIH